jgi:L-lactate dehydrogenase complex protein LldF
MKSHPKNASVFLKNEPHANWHDETLWWVRQKRDKAVNTLEDWEKLRESASQIKEHTLTNLDHYLEEFERNATQNGIQVHWAKDTREHNAIIYELLKERNISFAVKSKSMLTEECELNTYLESQGIEIIDTDLGEWDIELPGKNSANFFFPEVDSRKHNVTGLLLHPLNDPFSQICVDNLNAFGFEISIELTFFSEHRLAFYGE